MSDLGNIARSWRSNEADFELECVQELSANNNRWREAFSLLIQVYFADEINLHLGIHSTSVKFSPFVGRHRYAT